MVKKVFISFPYGHEDVNVINERVKNAAAYAMKLKSEGHTPFAPAVMGHMMVDASPNVAEDISFNAWKRMCMDYLEVCNEVHVIYTDDDAVHESSGVQAEIKRARELNIRVKFIV